jgi:hypothetical protein
MNQTLELGLGILSTKKLKDLCLEDHGTNCPLILPSLSKCENEQ